MRTDDRWQDAWRAAWHALGLGDGDPAALRDLLARHAEPQRRYHTLRHLDECLTRLAPVLGRAVHPGEVAIALFHHDAVYEPRAEDNEARSADLAAATLARAGADPATVARVRELVMATRHEAPAPSPDAALLVDVDLGILAAPAARFDEYERDVRAEYAWVPDLLFRRARRGILQGFLDRERIYTSGAFDDDEPRARENLRRSLARLAG